MWQAKRQWGHGVYVKKTVAGLCSDFQWRKITKLISSISKVWAKVISDLFGNNHLLWIKLWPLIDSPPIWLYVCKKLRWSRNCPSSLHQEALLLSPVNLDSGVHCFFLIIVLAIWVTWNGILTLKECSAAISLGYIGGRLQNGTALSSHCDAFGLQPSKMWLQVAYLALDNERRKRQKSLGPDIGYLDICYTGSPETLAHKHTCSLFPPSPLPALFPQSFAWSFNITLGLHVSALCPVSLACSWPQPVSGFTWKPLACSVCRHWLKTWCRISTSNSPQANKLAAFHCSASEPGFRIHISLYSMHSYCQQLRMREWTISFSILDRVPVPAELRSSSRGFHDRVSGDEMFPVEPLVEVFGSQ